MWIISLISKCAQYQSLPFPPPIIPFVPGMDPTLIFNFVSLESFPVSQFEKHFLKCLSHFSFWRGEGGFCISNKITYIFLLCIIEIINLEADCVFFTDFSTGKLKGQFQNNISQL